MNQEPLSTFRMRLALRDTLPDSLTSCWQSPANIALIKYWGKRPGQLPLYPSLSMTLSACFTQTKVEATRRTGKECKLLVNHRDEHPYCSNGLSAFALCMLSIAKKARDAQIPGDIFLRDASFIARMGSGSACRSLYQGFTVWGKIKAVSGSCDLYACSLNDNLHPSFHSLRDTILVVSSKPKPWSSSSGHLTMNHHPYSGSRIIQAKTHLIKMLSALSEGNMNSVGSLAETEALTLHALFISSADGAVLLEHATLEIIKRTQKARRQGLTVYFTLDAGPNVHLIHPESESQPVHDFCTQELLFRYLWNDRRYFKPRLDLERLKQDIARGIYLRSTIPVHRGLGSSGALCASVFNRYGKTIPGKWTSLLNILARMESFFHGVSSGFDPLISLMNIPLRMKAGRLIRITSFPAGLPEKRWIFLLDAGQPSTTKSLVTKFLDTCLPSGRPAAFGRSLVTITDQCISGFLKGDESSFRKSLMMLSRLQFNGLHPMIPDVIVPLWEAGLDTEFFSMKLCGSGGGGFFLLFMHHPEKAKQLLIHVSLKPLSYDYYVDQSAESDSAHLR